MGSNPAEFENPIIKTESKTVAATDTDFIFVGSFKFF
jgi:hypothetical protein